MAASYLILIQPSPEPEPPSYFYNLIFILKSITWYPFILQTNEIMMFTNDN